MNFDLPDGLREILTGIREFGARAIAPAARGWDERGELSAELPGLLADQGLLGLQVPIERGGIGLSELGLCLAVEALARDDGASALFVATHCAAMRYAFDWHPGCEEIEQLAEAAVGRVRLTIPRPGAPLQLTREGESISVSGRLIGVVAPTRATHVVVSARDGDALLVGHVALDTPRVTLGAAGEQLGLRALDRRDLVLDRAALEGARAAGDSPRRAANTLARCEAAVALGLGEASLDAAARYARDRRQFGRPIADLQAIQWMLADSRVELDASRALLSLAALSDDPAHSLAARRGASASAKGACHRALQIHGGYGYTREFPIERALRDATALALERGVDAGTEVILAAPPHRAVA